MENNRYFEKANLIHDYIDILNSSLTYTVFAFNQPPYFFSSARGRS